MVGSKCYFLSLQLVDFKVCHGPETVFIDFDKKVVDKQDYIMRFKLSTETDETDWNITEFIFAIAKPSMKNQWCLKWDKK